MINESPIDTKEMIEMTTIPKNSPFRMSYPAVASDDAHWTDRVVTEGHAEYCRTWGHAKYIVDEVVQGFCPRCGDTL